MSDPSCAPQLAYVIITLLHSLIPGLKPTFSTNLSHLSRLLVPPRLPSRIIGLNSTYYVYQFIVWFVSLFVQIFCLIPYSRLSSLPVRFDWTLNTQKLESLGAVSYSPSIVTMALSCISSEIKHILVESRDFFILPLHSAPALGRSPSEYCHSVWCGKTRMVGLPDGENFLRICITVYTQYRRVTDRRTSCDV